MRMSVKQMLAGVLCIGAAMLMMNGCGGKVTEEAPPVVRPVTTMTVGGSMAGRLSFPGTVQASQRVNLSFRVSGPLIQFPVNEGQEVQKGQLLARIDPRDYRIALDESQAAFQKAEADYNRYQRLYEKEAVPLADLDYYRAQRDVAKSRLDVAEAELSDTYLKAPYSGRIGEKFVENYEEVRVLQAVLSLHDVTRIEIVVDIPEYLMANMRGGKLAQIEAAFDSAPDKKFPVEIFEASAQADSRTQTFRVTLTMPQPEEIRILPGMTALVFVHVREDMDDEEMEQFIIPARAVYAGDDGTAYVWVIDDDMRVHAREVEAGQVTGEGDIRIHDGLSAGEMIAVTGVTQLREGMQVRSSSE